MISPANLFDYFLFFLPGLLSFSIYRFLSDKELGNLDRVDFVLILFFTAANTVTFGYKLNSSIISYPWLTNTLTNILPIQITTSNIWLNTLFLVLSAGVLGVSADVCYRLLINNHFKYYTLLDKVGIRTIDTTDTPIWESELLNRFSASLNNFTSSEKIKIYFNTGEKIEGFLIGYSKTDLKISQVEHEDGNLTYKDIWVPKRSILKIEFLNESFEDNYDFTP